MYRELTSNRSHVNKAWIKTYPSLEEEHRAGHSLQHLQTTARETDRHTYTVLLGFPHFCSLPLCPPQPIKTSHKLQTNNSRTTQPITVDGLLPTSMMQSNPEIYPKFLKGVKPNQYPSLPAAPGSETGRGAQMPRPVASKYYMLAMGKRTHAHTIPMISLAVGRPRPVSFHPLLTAPSSLGFSNEAVKVRGEARCLSRLKRTFMTTLDCPTPAHHTKAPLFIRCRLLCTHTCESAAWKFILFVHQKHSPSVCTLKRVLWLFIKWLPCGHISEFTMR